MHSEVRMAHYTLGNAPHITKGNLTWVLTNASHDVLIPHNALPLTHFLILYWIGSGTSLSRPLSRSHTRREPHPP